MPARHHSSILLRLFTWLVDSLLVVASLTTLILCISCSDRGDKDSDHTFRIIEEDGITVARTTGGPKYQSELFAYDLLFELTEDSTRVESLLYQPHDFLMDDRGYFYVLDGGNDRIAVFNNLGRFAYSIGRQGGGPGEFGRTFNITEICGDTLHVLDRSQHRITRFLTDGSLIDVIPVRRPTVFCQSCYILSEEWFLSLGTEQTSPFLGPVQMRSHFFVHDSVGDTLQSSAASWVTTFYRLPDTNSMKQYPLGPKASHAYRRGIGWIITDGIEPVLEIQGGTGQVLRRIELNLPRIPITRNDYALQRAGIDWGVDFIDEFIEVTGAPESYREGRMERLNIAKQNIKLNEYRAFWRSVYIDDTGFIWLKVPEHFIEETEAGDRPRYMVLDPQGEMLGYTRVPNGRPFNINNGHFLSTEWVPEETRNSLRIYRIRSIIEGLQYP